NSALFLIIGKGFFDYDASWADTNYLRITNQFGFNPTQNPENALIRAQVENTQYGWIPRVSLKHNNGELIFGGELRFHRSDHWGRVQYANAMPPGYDLNRNYYFYNGSKDIIGGFLYEAYQLNDRINLLGEIQ